MLVLAGLLKRKKWEQYARPFVEANKALKEIYRRRKHERGLRGSSAWNYWYRLQRRVYTGLGRTPPA
jgi:hypothetical protein